MLIVKKVVVATIAITTAIFAAPAYSQSLPPTSTYTNSDNQISSFNSIEVTRPILIGGVAATALTALGLATALLSGKNKHQLETELKSAKEIAVAAKTSKVQNFLTHSFRERGINSSEESLKAVATDLIEGYHTQALAQATAQFWFSVTAASFGFLLILYTGFSSLRSKEPQMLLVNTLPGLAIEAVAALFFSQAENTRKRATELYDRLRSDDRQIQAIDLIESIENQELRDLVKARWALQIVGLETQPLDLSSYLPKPPLPNDGIQQYPQ
ncbi:TRADD-N-associated membrane domain-containing protein [Iningainema tapete]|uniref:Cyanobacterial TRADD-N associated 2 transmembrane domain-containing protein n=1 Tax=Iningainema tapete BLCC-T55 TaxID=2748662 RepID=A0A8J7CFI4_9CYAN|nr:hypothetical protein [Iningainema tapete]MBD2774960.1 hypothetical protein [Iningainema tapete BLCC-T55]